MSTESTSMEAQSGWSPPGINPWLIALTVTLATFMEVLDTSIANVALPHIAGSLSVSVEESTWVLTSYLVANAIVLPLSGWLSMLMGRKRFYMTCVVLFTISSALCGMATSMEQLVFFRVLQGLGGGGLQPSEQAILVDTFPPYKRGMAMAVYAVAILVAPILGPTLGGWITDNYSWRWIFFINVPVGILSVFLSGMMLQDPPYLKAQRLENKKKPLSMDYIGLGLMALGLGCLEVVLDRGQTKDWFGSPMIVEMTVVMVAALVGAVFWELQQFPVT
ncbi:MAG: DHA2 family efflux MFS transporter permease subunit [Isosphaeraceae bacterium]